MGSWSGTAVGATVTAGVSPVEGDGTPDGWTNILYINEQTPFDFSGTGCTREGHGLYTPFVAEPLVENPITGADFIVRAIGTTREAGTAFTCDGLFRYPFHDTETFVVQNNWVAGFITSDPAGERTDAMSPIPFIGPSDVQGWLAGSPTAGTGGPAIQIGQPITEGSGPSDADAYGLRHYQFNIQAESGDIKPPLQPGGRVGDACPPPVEPDPSRIGAPFPLTNGTPDGWSGIPVLYGYQLPAGESVEVVRYYAADDRSFQLEEELYHVVPLIVRQEDGSVEGGEGIFSVWEVGPPHTPTEIGEQEFAWGSSKIPNDGHLYHPAVLQWQQDLNDTDGGVVAFGNDGEGMHYFNVDTSTYVPGEDIGEVEAGLVLSDLEIHSSGVGGRAYQLNFQMSSGEPDGDFNNDGLVDAQDIDALTVEVVAGTNNASFDLNADKLVDQTDRSAWVEQIKKTYFGDSNLDLEFSSSDLVFVFQRGKYENTTEDDSGWEDGDWDGDRDFTSSDFVIAFQGGGYEKGPRAANQAVPEPSSLLLVALGAAWSIRRRRLMVRRQY
jgi:hypothetical protein